jgi:ribonucleoside-triphosphate reductase
MFSFPKPEIRVRREYFTKSEHEENMYLAAKLSAKFGSSYFDNLIPGYRDSEGQDCYQCCAFRLEEDIGSDEFQKKIMFEDGAHFSMGGLQVVTLNLPRLAYIANGNDNLLLETLRSKMELARRVLMIKRKFIQRQIDNGMLPFLTQQAQSNGHKAPPLFDVLNSSPIFGFVGVNEMVQYHTGAQLHESQDAVRFGLRVIAEMEHIRKMYSEETGLPFAVARTPAESCSTRLAIMDLLHYNGEAKSVVKGDISNWRNQLEEAGRTAVPAYYTNGFMVNYESQTSLAKKIAIEEKAFPLLSGGNIFHVFLGEAAPDPDALMKLNQRIAMNTQLGYYSYTRDLSVCKRCHSTASGLIEVCPNCGHTDLDWFSRITGYYQNVSGWNAGKREELKRRYRVLNGSNIPTFDFSNISVQQGQLRSANGVRSS